jgi:hypothetical protein
VHVLPCVNLKASLVLLVRHCVSSHGTHHHLVASHEIVHHIFQLGQQSLRIDDVKENHFVSSNLDSDVTLDKVEETSYIDDMVVYPLKPLLKMVPLLLKE